MQESKLVLAVQAESKNWKTVSSLYADSALELAALFESSPDAVHIYMCTGQDATGESVVWHRTMMGLKKALSKLPDPLVFSETRDFRPSHRNKAPLFTLIREADKKAAAKTAAAEAAAKAAAIEAAAAEAAAIEAAVADAATTVDDIVNSLVSECERLGRPLAAVFESIGLRLRESEPEAFAAAVHHLNEQRLRDNRKAA